VRRRRDPEAQRARRAAADAGGVLEAAARSLGGAPRSQRSLGERLVAAGYDPAHVAAAIERLVAIGLIDDERLARALIESRDRSRQRGDRSLLQELRRRGIDESLALRLLAERAAAPDTERLDGPADLLGAPQGAEERAARAALAKMRRRPGDPRREAQRLAQALARRGFPPALCWNLAREHVTNLLAAEGAGGAPDEPFDPLGEEA
jgi:regulatory protein